MHFNGTFSTFLSVQMSHFTSHVFITENCEGVNCGPGKVCKMKGGRPQCVCSPNCSNISTKHAVCGSDGNSYKDECALLMARCRGHPDLEIMYQGECKSKPIILLMSVYYLTEILQTEDLDPFAFLKQIFSHNLFKLLFELLSNYC